MCTSRARILPFGKIDLRKKKKKREKMREIKQLIVLQFMQSSSKKLCSMLKSLSTKADIDSHIDSTTAQTVPETGVP